MCKLLIAFTACTLSLVLSSNAAQSGDKKNPAATPSPRLAKGSKDTDKNWLKQHDSFVAIAKKGDVDVLFLGDSITAGWRNNGKGVWSKSFGTMKPANFGIGGDKTEHVLWRIQNGELEGITPKVAVLMIGTNNTAGNSAEQIAGGVTAIVKTIETKSPKTKVLLLAVFPRGNKDTMEFTPQNDKIKEINKIIAKLDDGKKVKYLDIGSKFLKDSKLSKEIMPDALHLSAAGYQIWADAMTPTLTEMLKN